LRRSRGPSNVPNSQRWMPAVCSFGMSGIR
jgi:hypothetical protein